MATLTKNSDRCQGHGRCYAVAPHLVDSDDLGYALVLNDGHIRADQLPEATSAVNECPERALSLDGTDNKRLEGQA